MARNLSKITADETILKLKQIFSHLGIPQILVFDNVTAFTSATFSNFCALNGIQQIKTPLFHSQLNGQVEHFVDIFKRALLKKKQKKTKGRGQHKKYSSVVTELHQLQTHLISSHQQKH